MKLLFVFAVLLTSMTAFAGDRNTAYEVVCKNMSFESDKARCIQVIKPFTYFDDGALSICPVFPFASTQMECLGYVGNKRYEAYEVESCRNAVFDSEKLRCLRENGSISNGGGNGVCIPSRELVAEMRQAQQEIRTGNTGTADKRLSYLINKLQSCPY